MRTRKHNKNKGFSLLELLITIGIMSVVVTTVGILMTTSSETYNRVSTDSQLQSEAQIVANSIMNIAVDCSDVKWGKVSDIDSAVKTKIDTVGTMDDKALFLSDTVKDKRFIIVRETDTNKLYYFEQDWNNTSHVYNAVDPDEAAILGEYITDFKADTGLVSQKNLLAFNLSYDKNRKKYDGDYQIFLRNRKYSVVSANEPTPDKERLISVDINPKPVYISVKGIKDATGATVTRARSYGYLKSEATDVAIPTNETSHSMEFTATALYKLQGLQPLAVPATLNNADAQIFTLVQDPGTGMDKAKYTLQFEPGKANLKTTTKADFSIVGEEVYTGDDGVTQQQDDHADIHIRRVNNVLLTGNASQLKPLKGDTTKGEVDYTAAPYNQRIPTTVPELPSTNFVPLKERLELTATLSQYNVAVGEGGLAWKLEYKDAYDATDTWHNDFKYGSVVSVQTLNNSDDTNHSFTNYVNLVRNRETCNKVFRVTVTSTFDSTYTSVFYFGVITPYVGQSNGLHSRGYYQDVTEYIYSISDVTDFAKTRGGIAKIILDPSQGDSLEDAQIKFVEEVDADGVTHYYLFVDYDVYSYTQEQLKNFFTKREIRLVAICGNGERKDAIKYYLEPITVRPRKPEPNEEMPETVRNGVFCVAQNSTVSISAQYEYWNMTRRQDVGLYAKTASAGESGFSENLNVPGKENVNRFIRIAFDDTSLGTVRKYVDKVNIDVTAKALDRYPIDYLVVRSTLEPYYTFHSATEQHTNSFYDFRVYIANVEGKNKNEGIYLPGPDAIPTDDDRAIGWPSNFDYTKGSKVRGINEKGDYVDVTVKRVSGMYTCTIDGVDYKFDSAKNCWRKKA